MKNLPTSCPRWGRGEQSLGTGPNLLTLPLFNTCSLLSFPACRLIVGIISTTECSPSPKLPGKKEKLVDKRLDIVLSWQYIPCKHLVPKTLSYPVRKSSWANQNTADKICLWKTVLWNPKSKRISPERTWVANRPVKEQWKQELSYILRTAKMCLNPVEIFTS